MKPAKSFFRRLLHSRAQTHSTSQPTQPFAEVEVATGSPETHESIRPLIHKVWKEFGSALHNLADCPGLLVPLKDALQALSKCIELLDETTQNDRECEDLASSLTVTIKRLKQYLNEGDFVLKSDSIVETVGAINNISKKIRQRGKPPSRGRLFEAQRYRKELEKDFMEIKDLFKRLQDDVNFLLAKLTTDMTMDNKLNALSPSKSARYDSGISGTRPRCTKNTRQAILGSLDSWTTDPKSPHLMWMNGMAGTGKTTIACSYSEIMDQRGNLAASFFCSRTSPDCRDVHRIIPTIAYQLARFSPGFRAQLYTALTKDYDLDCRAGSKQYQLPQLDALDECDNPELVEILLEHLIENKGDLPLKFLVTSRPEPDMYQTMESHFGLRFPDVIKSLDDEDLHSVQADIQLYLGENLRLSENELSELAQRCGSLFIYAATANVLSNRRPAEIDSLYSMVLNSAFDQLEEEEANNFWEQQVGFCFSCVLPRFYVRQEAVRRLVSFSRAEHNYLMAEQCFGLMKKELRFNIYRFESSYVADKTIEIQRRELEGDRVDDLIEPALWYACCYWGYHLEQTTGAEDKGLECQRLRGLSTEVNIILSQKLLFWMEILNLRRSMSTAVNALVKARLWLLRIDAEDTLVSLAEDARNFVVNFAASPASISTPHIYTSLLPFCPRSSAIFHCYRKHFRGVVEPDDHVMHVREMAALASWTLDSGVASIAYSCDGTFFAFGCLDGTVGVRNSSDGAVIFSVKDHTDHVWSVAFFPEKEPGDQIRLVSGSEDGTIRTWAFDRTPRSPHATPTTKIIGSLPSEINSVAFSPSGKIASGSSDGAIRIWDSFKVDEETPVELLPRHEAAVWAVAFSPDGTRVASGSDDRTIQIWNPQNGQLVLGPLKAQAGDINSIAFSPNGTRLAGSSDKTICVWDLKEGTTIAGPFLAHNDKVLSVTFSPDGKHLASGSLDRTIRVWDPLSGELIAGPFEGHIGPVNSIAFSPDNTRIISSSSDSTIRIWDPRQGTLNDDVLKSHTGAVSSVAFSPHGQHIASCSYDGTLRVWDVRDNLPVSGGTPLGSHNEKVMSLAFSSDGAWVVTGSFDHTARVWDIRNPNATPVSIFKEHEGAISSVAFSPDDTFVASAGGLGDNTIRLWNPSTGTPISDPLMGHTDEVLSVAISPDGANLTSGSRDKTLRVWGLKNRTTLRVLEGHTRAVWSVVYSRDGAKLASSSSDGTICIWETQNYSMVTHPINAGSVWVSSIAFSPDGDFIASGADDCTVRLWDSNTGHPIGRPYEGHCDIVWSVAFSPSGTHIISGSHDGTIRFWDMIETAPTVSGQDSGMVDCFTGVQDLDTTKTSKQ
ncbi:hypothetical protein RSAG8_11285, partial [Rhizoctonia solani AG-8 WAC10335]